MTTTLYRTLLTLLALGFALAFGIIVVPPLLASGDVPGAFAAGFVNPFASGYALDTLACWGVFGLLNTAIFHYFNIWLNATMIVTVPLAYLAICGLSAAAGGAVLVGFLARRTKEK